MVKHPHTTASFHQYYNILCNILDKHAPIKRKVVPLHPNKGFVNTDILSAKRFNDNPAINQNKYCAAVSRYNF